jgi:hypothetical protein
MFCQYRNIGGIPGQGIHKHVLGIAIVDVVATILGGWIFARAFNLNVGITIFCAFVLGIIVHKLFCVNTTLNNFIFKGN